MRETDYAFNGELKFADGLMRVRFEILTYESFAKGHRRVYGVAQIRQRFGRFLRVTRSFATLN